MKGENKQKKQAIPDPMKEAEKDIKKSNRRRDRSLDVNQEFEKDLKELPQSKERLKSIFDRKQKKKALRGIKKDLKKYKPTIKGLPVYYHEKPVVAFAIGKEKYEKPFTREQIEKITEDVSKKLKDGGLDGYIGVALRYDAFWRGSYFQELSEHVHLFSFEDYDDDKAKNLEKQQGNKFKSFVIYFMSKNQPKGGFDSRSNDCLYYSLKEYLHSSLSKVWSDPIKMKSFLGLKYDDLVDIKHIPTIEAELIKKKVNVRINVSGEYVHTSTNNNSLMEINLSLIREHYMPDYKRNSLSKKFTSFREKTILMYDERTLEGYDGYKKWMISKKELKDVEYNHNSPYILGKRTYNFPTIEEDYEEYIEAAKKLRDLSEGKVNLFKTGCIKLASLDLFDRFTKHIITEPLQQDEAQWIFKASTGALIFADTTYEGKGYQYDVVSMYPSIMASMQMIPLKRGEFQKLDANYYTSIYSFGIYRCRVYKSDNENVDKLFKFNYSDYYTHISLNHAKELGLKIEMIVDDQPNFLSYDRSKCLIMNQVFTDFVSTMFKLKAGKVGLSKEILNILWGALCQVRFKKDNVEDESEDKVHITEVDDIETLTMKPFNDDFDRTVVRKADKSAFYKTEFARMCPFLLSKGRVKIAKIMEPIIDDVVRCHTDGFITKTAQPALKTGYKLGELKYVGSCEQCKIVNKNIVEGEFKV